ncbi:flagellar protein FliT [Niveibacterium sp. 24ML]|uniref:flagellar protein FliT n=1 Tax=Niveibacterium sp. 24ML TaxID=2985512 RepID=UPI00226DA5F1|nr:flagellar protein FliT [Niveibacterium sp. 24ML]MCX9156145.1 flagellar protein FliT [Niveibacterium sp. 24ML]
MSTLALYENMSGLSAQMAVAARENDWDRVSALEAQITQLRNDLLNADSLDRPAPLMSDTERRKKADLIKRILADDREVRRHTEPWMDSVRTMLGGASRGRAMRAAYSVVAE